MFQSDGLTHLVEEGIIDAVHARLMSGKEATVYVVEREGHLGAAKVYKARDERTFKKTASYVEGRNQTRNSRDRRAMQKKSAYGRGLIEDNWQEME
ncbi:MAG TPA: serine protein kinase RIO, partial [Polyangia bacterium]|nr:serine protein kinase RIO [Polyangia bacterium]